MIKQDLKSFSDNFVSKCNIMIKKIFNKVILITLLCEIISCSTLTVPSGNAEKMLGKSEMEIKQNYGIPSRQFQENGYTVLMFSERIYRNLQQYGSIDKYQHTMFWIKDGRCTNWLVKEDVNPPDQVTYRIN
jgi:hypothetical protein